MRSQWNLAAGEFLYHPKVPGIKFFAECGQRDEFGGMLGRVGGKHAGGGPGGLRHDTPFFDHPDAVAVAGQFHGDGETDDSAARDNDVLTRHSSIVG